MTGKKKIYISLPIAFQEDTVYERNEEAKQYLKKWYKKYDFISPIDHNHIDDEALGAELAVRFPEERRKRPFLYDETFEVLDQLKGRYQLLLLTNGAPELQNTKLEITPEIAPYFDEIIISGAFGKGKPDASIFRHALEKLNVSPGEALMIGDNLMTDILGSNRAGIRNVWVNREDKPKKEVEPTYEIKDLKELLPLLKSLE